MKKASDIFKIKNNTEEPLTNASSVFAATVKSEGHFSKDQRDKVNNIIADVLAINVRDISQSSRLSDLGADSLDGVDLIMKLESAFNVTIPDSKAANIHTVGDIYKELGI